MPYTLPQSNPALYKQTEAPGVGKIKEGEKGNYRYSGANYSFGLLSITAGKPEEPKLGYLLGASPLVGQLSRPALDFHRQLPVLLGQSAFALPFTIMEHAGSIVITVVLAPLFEHPIGGLPLFPSGTQLLLKNPASAPKHALESGSVPVNSGAVYFGASEVDVLNVSALKVCVRQT